jgi:predicted nucleic acid-binding protein
VNPVRLVLDTSVFFSLLLGHQSTKRRRMLAEPACIFYCPRFFLVELFKHKERIARMSSLDEDELLECFHELLARLTFIDEGTIAVGTWMEARRLCRDVDPKDTPFIALAMHLDCPLWTDDAELKRGLRVQGFDRFFSE